jgi:hypothetical protein
MKRRIENGDLLRIRKVAAGRTNGFEIVRIVQRRKRAQGIDLPLHFIIDENGIVEEVSTVNDAMSNGLDALAAQRGPELFDGASKRLAHIGDSLDYAVAEPLRIAFRCGSGCQIEEMEFE